MTKLSGLNGGVPETTFTLSDFLVKVKASGVGDVLVSASNFLLAMFPAWAAFAASITAASGTFTTVSSTGKYQQFGKTVIFDFAITITTNGTAAIAIIATLPVTAKDTTGGVGFGRADAISGKMQQAYLASSTTFKIQNYDGTYGGATSEVIRGTIVYEAA